MSAFALQLARPPCPLDRFQCWGGEDDACGEDEDRDEQFNGYVEGDGSGGEGCGVFGSGVDAMRSSLAIVNRDFVAGIED